MKLTLFSVEEANRLAVELRPELKRLSAMKRELDGLQARAEALSLALVGAATDNPDAAERKSVAERRDALAAQLKPRLQAIHRHGCLVKDLDQGLVDFYALAGDRLVFLCWHMGEREVAHWHTLEGGFAGRQPLDKSAPA